MILSPHIPAPHIPATRDDSVLFRCRPEFVGDVSADYADVRRLRGARLGGKDPEVGKAIKDKTILPSMILPSPLSASLNRPAILRTWVNIVRSTQMPI